MKLSKNNKLYMIKEIELAAKEMRNAKSIIDKIYFFSVVYGAANRIINIEFDPELSFVHNVTNSAYNQIQAAATMIRQGQMTNTIDAGLFDKIADCLDKMAKSIANDEPTYKELENISNLAYSTTGNGHYLVLSGRYTP